MSLSVDVIVAAHDQLSAPFAGMTESTQVFTRTLERSAGEMRPSTQALTLLGSTVSRAGLEFANLGPVTRAAAMMIRSSGETAKAGWIGVLGPIALVVAGVTGLVAIVEKLKSKWAEEAEEARKAMEEERAAAKARADFLIEQELRIAKAREDSGRVFEIEMQRGGETARKAIQERYEEQALAELKRQGVGEAGLTSYSMARGGQEAREAIFRAYGEESSVLAAAREERDKALAKLQAAEDAERARFNQDTQEKERQALEALWAGQRQADADHLRAVEAAIAAQEKADREHDESEKTAAELRRREWAESLRDPQGEYRGLQQAIEEAQKALLVSLAGGGGQSPEWILSAIAGWKQAQGDIAEAFKNAGMNFGASQKAPAYRQIEAFESMTMLRAPGVDPMERQVELSKRMLDELKQVSKNTTTRPPGGQTSRPAPVY